MTNPHKHASGHSVPHHQPMHELPPHFAPLDPGRVDMTDPNETEYWCREFDCTEAELREAIDKVGSHTSAVREELCK